MTAVSWLDWKLGARMLLKHPALTNVLKRELADLGKLRVASIEPVQQRQMLRSKLAEWKGLLRERVPNGIREKVECRFSGLAA